MVYAAANDGMLHGFLGTSGSEQFAYVPSALFQGPTGAPQTNGLAALGNPNYATTSMSMRRREHSIWI